MKRIISLALVLVMLVSSLALSVNAMTVTYPTYADAQDGELLYVADFTGDEYYQPSTENAIANAGWEWVESETLVANVDETKPNEVSFTKEKKVNSAWGGDIESLPLGEGYAYTIKFTVSRTANKSIGLLFDGHFGCYLQAAKGRLQRNGSKLAGHEFVSYGANPLVTIPGSEVVNEEKPSVQEYAFSINGDNVTYSLYIKEVTPTSTGYLTFAAMKKTKSGVYQEIVAIRTTEEPVWRVGSSVKMYLKCLGMYDVVSDEGTSSYPYFDLQWVD